MEFFLGFLGALPDSSLLLGGALITGIVALAIAWLSRILVFTRSSDKWTDHAKLADLVHGSLLAFTVFTLALVLTDVRSNLGKALDATLREASILHRLDAELQLAAGPEAESARQSLRRYVEVVTLADWPSLAAPVPKLSPDTDIAGKSLQIGVRTAAKANPDAASALNGYLNQAEDLRYARLESATKSVPNVFWWIIFAFLVGAMVLNGRHPLDLTSGLLIFLHMAGIGLVLALIVIMDQPFRGETSVSSSPISRALLTDGLSE